MKQAAYWVLKFLVLAGLLAAIGGALYGLCLLSCVIDWRAVKQGFYTIITMAIFFYAAALLRSVGRYFNAKEKRCKAQE